MSSLPTGRLLAGALLFFFSTAATQLGCASDGSSSGVPAGLPAQDATSAAQADPGPAPQGRDLGGSDAASEGAPPDTQAQQAADTLQDAGPGPATDLPPDTGPGPATDLPADAGPPPPADAPADGGPPPPEDVAANDAPPPPPDVPTDDGQAQAADTTPDTPAGLCPWPAPGGVTTGGTVADLSFPTCAGEEATTHELCGNEVSLIFNFDGW